MTSKFAPRIRATPLEKKPSFFSDISIGSTSAGLTKLTFSYFNS